MLSESAIALVFFLAYLAQKFLVLLDMLKVFWLMITMHQEVMSIQVELC